MNIKRIKELLEIMKEHGLQTMEVEEKGVRYRFDRESETPAAPSVVPIVVPQVNGIVQAEAAPAQAEAPKASEEDKLIPVKAQMVGTLYYASTPDAEQYVQVGDHVTADTVVCIIEAMKVMNEITADCSGTIKKMLVENAQSVEYGQVIFLIEPD